jgi:hypothetical protein
LVRTSIRSEKRRQWATSSANYTASQDSTSVLVQQRRIFGEAYRPPDERTMAVPWLAVIRAAPNEHDIASGAIVEFKSASARLHRCTEKFVTNS